VIDVSENGTFSGKGWLDLVVGGLTGRIEEYFIAPDTMKTFRHAQTQTATRTHDK